MSFTVDVLMGHGQYRPTRVPDGRRNGLCLPVRLQARPPARPLVRPSARQAPPPVCPSARQAPTCPPASQSARPPASNILCFGKNIEVYRIACLPRHIPASVRYSPADSPPSNQHYPLTPSDVCTPARPPALPAHPPACPPVICTLLEIARARSMHLNKYAVYLYIYIYIYIYIYTHIYIYICMRIELNILFYIQNICLVLYI